MLSFSDPKHSRRDFLRIGSLGLGGLSLSQLLSAQAHAASSEKPLRDKSVIFLFMHGGPSQIETFDPKMDSPAEIRSATGEVKTSIPGITLGGTFTKLAKYADRFSIVRSFVTGDGNHDIKPIVGRDTFGANLGAIYAHIAGINHPVTGMPTNTLLYPRSVDASTGPETLSFGNFASTGNFGGALAPFVPGAGGNLQKNMKLSLPMDRLDDRRGLLKAFDQMKVSLERAEVEGLDEMRSKAFNMILGTVGEAFDLSKEDPKVVAKYDTAPLVRPDQIDKKWKNYNHYVDNAKSLGKLLLLARRLCERGCGFVTVTTNFVWDMHSDENNAPVGEGMRYVGTPFDHAVSTFIEDLESRSLSDKILLVCCGEMGRTPKINNKGGRDHWGNLAPLMLVGGGLNMGQVIGQSNRNGGEPGTDPIRIQNLISTIMHTLFDIGKLRVVRGLPRQIQQMAEGEPIPGLLS
jgi:hypothetical protein